MNLVEAIQNGGGIFFLMDAYFNWFFQDKYAFWWKSNNEILLRNSQFQRASILRFSLLVLIYFSFLTAVFLLAEFSRSY